MFRITINRHFPAGDASFRHPASFEFEARTAREAFNISRAAQHGYDGETVDSWSYADYRRLKPGCEMSVRDSWSGLYVTVARFVDARA